jgi:hypothetical protein
MRVRSNVVDDEVHTLLGSEKDKSGHRLDMIGWLIDLDAQLVTISEKNFNKTLHAFFSFNIVSKTPTSFQNTYEYLAILFRLLFSKSLGLRDGVFAVLGDSRS